MRACAALLGTLLSAAPAWAQAPSFGPETLIGDLTNTDTPAVASDGAGTWLLLWASSEDPDRLGPDLDVLVSRSDDHGRRWSNPYPLTSTAADDHANDRWITDTSPALATDRRGTWVAAWQAWGGRDARDVLVATSRDNGRTFDAPRRLRGPGRDVVSTAPHIATDGRGRWIVVWTSQGGDAGFEYDVFFARSLDDGQTWSSPRPAAPYTNTDSWDDLTPRIATDGRGTWIIAWASAVLFGPDYDVVFIRSRDDGATWSDPAPLNADAATDGPATPLSADDFEPSIGNDGRGTWVATWTSPKLAINDQRDVFVARSVDQGATWSIPRPLTERSPRFNERPQLATDGRGRWLVSWSGRLGQDGRIYLRASDDDGRSFSATSTVPIGGSGRSDYPVLASDGVSGWALAARVRSSIAAGRVTVTVARGGCGDGAQQAPEACDGEPCCAPNCTVRRADWVCRAAAGPCDRPERCDGATLTCGEDQVRTSSVVCRVPASACDAAEVCDGFGSACPPDARAPDGVMCGPPSACVQGQVCEDGLCVPVPRRCDDGDPCTEDRCGASGCEQTPIEGCCRQDDDCEDDDACTIDVCVDNRCAVMGRAAACADAGAGTDAAPSPPPTLEPAGCGCRAGASTSPNGVLVLLGCAALALAGRRVNRRWQGQCNRRTKPTRTSTESVRSRG